jgi:hypothetical protein
LKYPKINPQLLGPSEINRKNQPDPAFIQCMFPDNELLKLQLQEE